MTKRLIDFGKYRGQSVPDVIRSDPQYLLWAHNNTDRFKLTEDEEKQCRAAPKNKASDSGSYSGSRSEKVAVARDDGRDDDDMAATEAYYQQDY